MKMANTRHDVAVRILYELCKPLSYYSEVHADHIQDEEYKNIDLLAPHKRGVSEAVSSYTPDVWCRTRSTNRIDVYEVWDGQSDSDSVEDILFAALTPGIYTLSIVCFEKETKDFATKLAKIILNSIHNAKGEPLLDAGSVLPYIVYLQPSDWKDEVIMRQELKRALNLDRS